MTATVLVTGANGFVGRAVCSELERAGYGIRAGVRDVKRGHGLPGELAITGDLNRDTDWSSVLQGVDAVIHLAARVHVMNESESDPLAAFRALNVDATIGLGESAARLGVKRFIYVSSIKVNGEVTHAQPFSPGDMPEPHDPYGLSKWEAEEALWKIAAETGLGVTVIRPPLVYGPGVGGNFARLLKLVQMGIPLPFGAVENRRSMVYVGNLASALVKCATHPAAAGQTYIVSDGEDLSTPGLVRYLAAMVGARARLWPVPVRLLMLAAKITGKKEEVDRLIRSLTVDSSALRTSLGWVPPFTIAEGLEETTRWFLAVRREEATSGKDRS